MEGEVIIVLLVFAAFAILPNVTADSINANDWSNFSSGGNCSASNVDETSYAFWKNYNLNESDPHLYIFEDGLNTGVSCWFFDESAQDYIIDSDYVCCPDGYSCTDDDNDEGNATKSTCQPSVNLCSDAKTKNNCIGITNGDVPLNTYNAQDGRIQISSFSNLTTYHDNTDGNGSCATLHDYYCNWNPAADEGMKCELKGNITKKANTWNSDGTCDTMNAYCGYTGKEIQLCTGPEVLERIIQQTAYAYNDTVSEHKLPSYFGTFFNENNTCKNYNSSRLCDASVQLPFFTFWNAMFAVLGIVAVYVIFGRKDLEAI